MTIAISIIAFILGMMIGAGGLAAICAIIVGARSEREEGENDNGKS